MFESCLELVDEYSELERQLAVPEVHNDQELARSLGRRYAQLRAVVAGYREWASLADDVAAATELAADDESFAAELPGLLAEQVRRSRPVRLRLVPDPDTPWAEVRRLLSQLDSLPLFLEIQLPAPAAAAG